MDDTGGGAGVAIPDVEGPHYLARVLSVLLAGQVHREGE